MITFKNKPDTTTPINAENLNTNFNELKGTIDSLKMTYNNVLGLSLKAGDSYQLTLPANTIFIEPLVKSAGGDYSGGQFIVPGAAFTYIVNNDNGSSYAGIWMTCNADGLVTISKYRHCGSDVTGFRIWYLSK